MMGASLAATAVISMALAAPAQIRSQYTETAVQDVASAALATGRRGKLPTSISVAVATTGKYANTGTTPAALEFKWPASASRFNFSSGDKWRFIDLADYTILTADGARAVGAWCDKQRGEILTPRLCGDARNAAALKFMSRPRH